MRMALTSLQCPLPTLALKNDVLLTTVEGADCHVVRDAWCVGLAPSMWLYTC